jgi:hypothetical protein
MRQAWLYGGAPLAVGVARLLFEVPPRGWTTLAPATWWRLAADTLVLDVALLCGLAPMLGVLAATRRIGAIPVAVFVTTFLLVSWVMTLMGFGPSGTALRHGTAAHLTLASAVLALVTCGGCCARMFRDPLDAIALALGLTGSVLLGVLVAGPLADALPALLATVLLGASPLVAVASAADIDLLRSPLLYEWSPLAHRGISAPAWPASMAGFLVMTLLGVAILKSLPPAHGPTAAPPIPRRTSA